MWKQHLPTTREMLNNEQHICPGSTSALAAMDFWSIRIPTLVLNLYRLCLETSDRQPKSELIQHMRMISTSMCTAGKVPAGDHTVIWPMICDSFLTTQLMREAAESS